MEVRSKGKSSEPTQASADTSLRILDEAERLVQTRGYNGFSYADIASALGVTKASLHYHYASKAALGRRLIERYCEGFANALQSIDESGGDGCERIRRYVDIYERVLNDGRMCLCGMLAAEYETLPEPMRKGLTAFFETNETWLAAALENGRAQGELDFTGDAREAANALTGALEGMMLVARAHGGATRFRPSAELLISNFCQSAAKKAKAPSRASGVRKRATRR